MHTHTHTYMYTSTHSKHLHDSPKLESNSRNTVDWLNQLQYHKGILCSQERSPWFKQHGWIPQMYYQWKGAKIEKKKGIIRCYVKEAENRYCWKLVPWVSSTAGLLWGEVCCRLSTWDANALLLLGRGNSFNFMYYLHIFHKVDDLYSNKMFTKNENIRCS